MDKKTMQELLVAQKSEITEHIIYTKLAGSIRDRHNSEVLRQIAQDELKHYNIWRKHTRQDAKPSAIKVISYFLISRIFGLTFGIKLMEKAEGKAQASYEAISRHVPEAKKVIMDENRHERQLIGLIDEELLRYVGSIVLGLNDALVELTGALAGFTFALANTRLIGVAGLITGIAASFSMAASEYLSKKSEASGKHAVKSSVYTGIAYVLTVLFLIFPYFIFAKVHYALGLTLINAVIVILLFTFYTSVAQEIPFRRRFAEMAIISFGIAALTFAIGFLMRTFLNVGA